MFDIPLPDQAAAAAFQVNPHIVRIALSEFRLKGGDATALCMELDFTPSDLEDPNFRLPYLKASQAIRRMCSTVEDGAFGLRVGMRHHVVSIGLVGFAAMASTTLGEAAMLALRFQEHAGSLLLMDIEIADDHAMVLATPRFSDVGIEAALVDGTFAAVVCAARQLGGERFRPRLVELVARQPTDSNLHQQFFQCPVRFGCARNRILIDSEWWMSKITSGDPGTLQSIISMLEASSAPHPKKASIKTVIASRLRESIRQPPSLAELAKLFNTSDRNLRRKLREAGCSYGDMVDQARKTRALELIANTRSTMSEMSEELGFNDPRSFRRAFKRWTGRTLASAMAMAATKTGTDRVPQPPPSEQESASQARA